MTEMQKKKQREGSTVQIIAEISKVRQAPQQDHGEWKEEMQ